MVTGRDVETTGDVTFADDQTMKRHGDGTDDYTVTKELTLDAGESSVDGDGGAGHVRRRR